MSETGVKKYQKVVYIIILCITLLWNSGILIAPLWSGKVDFRGDISNFLYLFYEKSCHQLEDRSFFLNSSKFGVCSRCTFVYLGFIIGVLFYPFIRKLNKLELPPIWIILTGAALVAIDAGLDIFNVVKNTFISREITGFIMGVVLPFYIVPGIIRIFYEYFLPPIQTKKK
jgi:uncharacterized membrane protein